MLPGTLSINGTDYAVEPKPHPDGCYVLRKLEGDGQTKYTVFPTSETCSCEAYKFNPGTPCKHVNSVREHLAAARRWQRRYKRIKPFTIYIDQFLEDKP